MGSNKTSDLIEQSLNLVKAHYRLGDIVSASELQGGYVNKTVLINVANCNQGSQFIIRRYNPITANEKDIQFEHCTIKHLISNGFKVAPNVIENKYGTTYIKQNVIINDTEKVRFWAVFECLRGKVRYLFFETHLSDAEMRSAATMLARLHNAGSDFHQKYAINSSRPRIMDYLPTFPNQYQEFAQKSTNTAFDTYLSEHRDEIFKKIDQASAVDVEFSKMPMGTIHGDYNQGNLTFQGSDVVGVFDFDWTKVDYRLFDLCQAIIYLCPCWEGEHAGSIDLEKFQTFLKAYNNTHISESERGGLTNIEIENIPLMLEIANQFVLFCIVSYFYYSENVVKEDYLKALKHYINIMIWLDANNSTLADVTQKTIH